MKVVENVVMKVLSWSYDLIVMVDCINICKIFVVEDS